MAQADQIIKWLSSGSKKPATGMQQAYTIAFLLERAVKLGINGGAGCAGEQLADLEGGWQKKRADKRKMPVKIGTVLKITSKKQI